MEQYTKTKKNLKFIENAQYVKLVHYDTEICFYSGSTLVLNNGGFFSPTTKRHMNAFFDAMCIDVSLFQKKHEWFVKVGENVIPYENHMRIKITVDLLVDKHDLI